VVVDYALHTMGNSSNQYGDLKTWLPLGHSYETLPPSPSHMVPASRRRTFCAFKGAPWSHPVRPLLMHSIQHSPDLDCFVPEGPSYDVKLEYRRSLLDTAISICPRGVHMDTVS
jgi:hypothetical protein